MQVLIIKKKFNQDQFLFHRSNGQVATVLAAAVSPDCPAQPGRAGAAGYLREVRVLQYGPGLQRLPPVPTVSKQEPSGLQVGYLPSFCIYGHKYSAGGAGRMNHRTNAESAAARDVGFAVTSNLVRKVKQLSQSRM